MLCIGLTVNLHLDNIKTLGKKSYNTESQVSSVFCHQADLNFQDILEFNLLVGSFFIFFSIVIQYSFGISFKSSVSKKNQTQIPEIFGSVDFNEEIFRCFCEVCLFLYGRLFFFNYLGRWYTKEKCIRKASPSIQILCNLINRVKKIKLICYGSLRLSKQVNCVQV